VLFLANLVREITGAGPYVLWLQYRRITLNANLDNSG
jgi:hypothetical protein